MNKLQEQWLDACLAADIPAITTDTSARIMAILYVHGGGCENMVLEGKFTNDVKYIQKRFHVEGGEVPDETFVLTTKHYVKELEDYMREHEKDESAIPEWAHKLIKERYGFKLLG